MPQGQAGTEVWAFWRTTGARGIRKKTSTYDATAASVIAEKMRWRMSMPAYTQIPKQSIRSYPPAAICISSLRYVSPNISTHPLILSFIPQPSPHCHPLFPPSTPSDGFHVFCRLHSPHNKTHSQACKIPLSRPRTWSLLPNPQLSNIPGSLAQLEERRSHTNKYDREVKPSKKS